MKEPIDNLYFNWLCAKVTSTNPPIYIDLLKILHRTEFVWVIIGDRNRAEDGIELRDYFLNESYLEKDPDWYNEPCSVLEALVALSYRAEFQTELSMKEWFWKFIENLGLDDYRKISPNDEPRIEDILQSFVWRTYDPTGYGGIFPMMNTSADQRKVEVWYQFCEYVEEQGVI